MRPDTLDPETGRERQTDTCIQIGGSQREDEREREGSSGL